MQINNLPITALAFGKVNIILIKQIKNKTQWIWLKD